MTRTTRAAFCLASIGLLAGGQPACKAEGAAEDEAVVDARRVFDAVVVEPGAYAEIDFEMGRGGVVDVAFISEGGALAWDVHSHVKEQLLYHHRATDSRAQHPFTAPASGFFSYLWENRGEAPVRLTAQVTIRGKARVHATHPKQ